MGNIYIFFTRECKPESLTGYAATKDSVLAQVSTLRSALQVQYQLGVTSKLKHDIYSKLGNYELSYLGGFDDQQHAFDVIQRLEMHLDAKKNQTKKEAAVKEEPRPSLETDETPKAEDQTSQNAVKEEVPVADVTTEKIVSAVNLDIQGEEEIKPFGPRRVKGNEVKGK